MAASMAKASGRQRVVAKSSGENNLNDRRKPIMRERRREEGET